MTLDPAHFALEINTTSADVTNLDGMTVDLPANHIRVEVDGLDANTPAGITVLGNTLTASSFIFEEDNGVVDFSATGLDLDLQAGSTEILHLTNGTAALEFSSAGVAGSFGLTLASGPQFSGLSLSADQVDLAINTTDQAIPTIGGVDVNLPAGPYVHVDLTNAVLGFSGVELDVGSFVFDENGQEVSSRCRGCPVKSDPIGYDHEPYRLGGFPLQLDAVHAGLGLAQCKRNQSRLLRQKLINPTLTLQRTSPRDSSGTLTGQITVSADSATLFPDKAFSAAVTGLNGNSSILAPTRSA